jgi:hypothetical protein
MMTHLLAEPEAIQIWGSEEAPEGFVWQGRLHGIEQISNRWQVHTRWWEPGKAIWRRYWKVTTDTGLLCQLYHDLLEGGWFLSRLYD